ncbi:MAG: hypothetical protein V1716_03260 [Candidatus Uhrbacteria bacterium]
MQMILILFLFLVGLVGSAEAVPARLIMTASSTMPDSGIVVAGSIDNLVGAFDPTSTGEAMTLNRLCLHNAGVDAAVDTVSVVYYDDWVAGWMTSTTALVNGYACFSTRITVRHASARQTPETIYVYFDASTSATPGDLIKLDWVDLGVQAIGLRTGQVYRARATTDFVDGPEMTWHNSQPTIFPVAGSPDGAGVRGFGEILRFGVGADSAGGIGPEGISFSFTSTDLANNGLGTGWNSCGQLADAAMWDVADASNLAVSLNGGVWNFYTADGTDCTVANPDEVIAYVTVTGLNETVWAGTASAYYTYFNSINASAVDDDSARLNVIGIWWRDGVYQIVFYDQNVNGLPLIGGSVIF